jgi:cytochrome c2
MISRFAFVAALAFALAACGSGDQSSDQPTGPEALPSEAAGTVPLAAPSETPAAEPSAAPSATPSPTATPSTAPSATPSPQAAATGAGTAGPPQAFNQCTACHSTTPGKTIIGPSLAGIYGEKAAVVPGFQFSDAMKKSGITWNAANLDAFLTNPQAKVPGTLMGFAGIKDPAQRKAVIDYLKTL